MMIAERVIVTIIWAWFSNLLFTSNNSTTFELEAITRDGFRQTRELKVREYADWAGQILLL
ncbi:MAG: hypothetical protein CL912_17980 [Deltaproteobacteria bacterium]|nr:hypothetical protein [Deltaproteobacteria bacterium]